MSRPSTWSQAPAPSLSRSSDTELFHFSTEVPLRNVSVPQSGPLEVLDDASQSVDDENSDLPEQHTTSFIAALPPTDGGRDAWLFLIGATTIEVLVWGLPFSVGVLKVYWTEELFKGEAESTITLAATLQTGLLYLGSSVAGPILSTFPRQQRGIQMFGLLAAVVSMISSGFITKPWHLIITMGCFYPFAVAYYLPAATLLFEWFHTRRGLAAGILFAGTGVGGTVFPFIVSGLLRQFGYKATMISLGVGYAVFGYLALIPIKRRIPITQHPIPADDRPSALRESSRKGFPMTWAMSAGVLTILLTSLGNFVPSLWLPSFANELNLRRPDGVALVAIMNAASVPGNALLGFLSDRYSLSHVIILSCVGSTISCLVFWGLAKGTGLLIAFAISFGLFGLSFSTLWPKMIARICGDDHRAAASMFYLFAFVRGVGNITSGPVSEALLKVNALQGAAGAYGFSNYGILLIYTGVTIFSGSLSGLYFKATVVKYFGISVHILSAECTKQNVMFAVAHREHKSPVKLSLTNDIPTPGTKDAEAALGHRDRRVSDSTV